MLRRQIRELEAIANDIDRHAELGVPYDLTFYNTYDGDRITEAQRESLTTYLKDNFKTWATTWLYLESDRIRHLINKPERHS